MGDGGRPFLGEDEKGIDGDTVDGFVEDSVWEGAYGELGTDKGRQLGGDRDGRRARSRKCGFARVVLRTVLGGVEAHCRGSSESEWRCG